MRNFIYKAEIYLWKFIKKKKIFYLCLSIFNFFKEIINKIKIKIKLLVIIKNN
jgi:hypothetical protein